MASTRHYVRPDVDAFLQSRLGQPDLSELSVEAARASYAQLVASADMEAQTLALVRDLACPGPGGEIGLRLFDRRATRDPGPALLFFHGGGFVVGSIDVYHNFCTHIAAELDLPVMSVDYRLAPEHPFPAAPDDCEAAARWIASNPQEVERTVTALIIMGESAGGNLTIVTTQALMAAPAAVPVHLQVPIYPAADNVITHESYHLFNEGYLSDKQTMAWYGRAYAAELNHPRVFPCLGQHGGMPPTVLVTAGLDPLRDSGRAYAADLVRAGSELVYLEMAGMIHGFCPFRKALPSAQRDMDVIFGAVRLMLARGLGSEFH